MSTCSTWKSPWVSWLLHCFLSTHRHSLKEEINTFSFPCPGSHPHPITQSLWWFHGKWELRTPGAEEGPGPTVLVPALILGLLQEQRALSLLPPPLAAAFKRRKQLRLHSWRVWSCGWEVGVFPEFLQDWVPRGTLVPPCLALLDHSGAAQAKPGARWTEALQGEMVERRGLGTVIFFGC